MGTDAVGNVLSNDTDADSVLNGETKVVAGVVAGIQGLASGSVGAAVTGSYGTIVIAADGSYTYSVDNSNATVQSLRTSGQSISDIFTYTMIDASGLTSTTQITLTINGANDDPTASNDFASATEAGGVANGVPGVNPSGNVLLNDSDPDSVGNGETKAIVGVVAGVQVSASGSVGSQVNGNFGAIAIASNGSYTYTVDNNNAAVEALRSNGQTLSDVFTYTMTDAFGALSTAQITVTVHGANDAPIATDNTALAIEAGGVNNGTSGLNPSGNVLADDLDADSAANGETQTVTGVAAGTVATASGSVGAGVAGNYGSISIAADGSYFYAVDNSNAAVQALRTTGQTLSDVFTYTIVDAAGLSSSAQITVTIDGRNDAPNAVNDAGNATEAGGVLNGTAGSNATGNVLTNDQDLDALVNGETKSVVGVVAGANPVTTSNAGSAVAGNFGSLTVQADGSYVYVVDEANTLVQALRVSGQTLTDTFSYKMVDTGGLESTAEITITIHGSNDAPVANMDVGFAVEAGGVANGTAGSDATGNVLNNDGDADSILNGETKAVIGVLAGVQSSANTNVGSSVAGTYGSIQINADGTYVYTVDNANSAVQSLRLTTDTLIDVFTYSMTDALGVTSTSRVTITIQGANDTPFDLAAAGLTVDENAANGTALGPIAFSDLDAGDIPSYTLIDDAGGRFAIDPVTGVVTVANGASLNFESSASHAITVRVTDAAGAVYDEVFTITLNDVNEFSVSIPNDINSGTNAVAENAAVGTAVGITANAQDPDASGNSVTYSLLNNDGGRFAIDSNTGVVTVAGAINRESDGPVRAIVVRATSLDGSTADRSFSINVLDIDEFDVGPLSDIEVDANAVNENSSNGTLVGLRGWAVDGDATLSTITYTLDDDASGRFRIDPNTGMVTTTGNGLDYESAVAHNITVRASSSDGSFVTANFAIAVRNVNERPISGNESYATSSSTTLVVNGSGVLSNDSDPESDPLTAVLVNGPASGNLILLPDGSFMYTPVVSFVGDVTFKYMASDGSLTGNVQTVTISITLPAAPAESGGGGNSNSGGGTSNPSNGSSDTSGSSNTDSTDSEPVTQTNAVVGALDTVQSQSRSNDRSSNSSESSGTGSEGDGNRTGVLEFDTESQAFWQVSFENQGTTMGNVVLVSTGHSAIARLNAEQDMRLVQSLSNAVDVISHLQEEINDNSQSAALEGAKFIAKTAIGSGVVVWVLHVSQVVAAFLAASSAWMHIDPLSILNATKDVAEGKVTDAAEALFDNDNVKKL